MQIKRFNTFKETELHLKNLIEIPGGSMNSKVSKVSLVIQDIPRLPKKGISQKPSQKLPQFPVKIANYVLAINRGSNPLFQVQILGVLFQFLNIADGQTVDQVIKYKRGQYKAQKQNLLPKTVQLVRIHTKVAGEHQNRLNKRGERMLEILKDRFMTEIA